MLNLMIFSLFVYGFSNIVIHGSIFSGFRNSIIKIFGDGNASIGKLVTCFICLPTWVGFMLTVVNLFFFPSMAFTPALMVFGLSYENWLIKVFFDGVVASGSAWLIHTIQEYFERSNPVE